MHVPELPEVETIKRQLSEKIIGLTIKNIEVKNPRSFLGNPDKLQGLKVQCVSRRAKMIIIDLTVGVRNSDSSLHLLIHLKMTGQLVYVDKNGQFGGGHPVPPFNTEVPNKFTHVSFEFTDGSHLYFNDIRRFGWIKVIESSELRAELEKFGPEPLSSDFTPEDFKARLLQHKNLKIKPVLMDQTVIAGLGNIYAAEACFYAKIRPDRKIFALSDQDFKNIFEGIKKILPLAIKYQGVSADNYVTLEGKQGDYYKKLWVYDREGKPCPNKCRNQISKMKLGGRGTYYCKKCQK